MYKTFEEFLRAHGIDPNNPDFTDATRATMQGIYDEIKRGESKGDGYQERAELILGTARAVAQTADVAVRADVLTFANDLVAQRDVTAPDAQRQLGDKVAELMKEANKRATNDTATADEQRDVFATPLDPDATLSRADIVSAFGEERSDRMIYDHAARSLVEHLEHGNAIRSEQLFKDLGERKGQLIIHEEDGRPTRRTITASSANVAIQTVSTLLLRKAYTERTDDTDALVTTIPGGADEITFPEVEADKGVKKLEEGEAYPFFGGSDRSVKSSHVKYGAAIAQTRENNLFDKLGRFMVLVKSLSRQLMGYRREFRLARICDSAAFDGRYVARPGNDSGTTAFYTSTEDFRGNSNLIASNALADETNLSAARKKIRGMKRKDGTLVVPEMRVILVDDLLHETAWKILNSTYCPSIASTDQTTQMLIPNPYGPAGMFKQRPTVISDPKVGTYAGDTSTWFAGDFAEQFHEIEHWGIEVVPVLGDASMNLRDIHSAWKGGFCIDLIALSNMFVVKNQADAE